MEIMMLELIDKNNLILLNGHPDVKVKLLGNKENAKAQ